MAKKGRIAVTQVRSQIGTLEGHRVTLRTLGLGRIGRTVVHTDTPQVRGMIDRVRHLVRVEPAK
jgi:large subunit ribosomal protein L30